MRHVLAASLVLAGCGDGAFPVGSEIVSNVESPVPLRDQIDLLFVIDNAPSMGGEQATLIANAELWVNTLEQIEGGLPNVHIGVVSQDIGAGNMTVGGGCGAGSGGEFTTDGCLLYDDDEYLAHAPESEGEATVNYAGGLAEAFACMVESVGAAGCPWRSPLEAMQIALARGTVNGFLRDEATLVVVFVGDGDDCSAANPALYAPSSTTAGPQDPFRCFAHGVICDGVDDPYATGPRTGCRPRNDGYLRPVEDYRATLLALKEDPRDIIVAAVTPLGEVAVEPGGRLAESCRRGDNAGTPAIRLQAFLEGFPDRHSASTTCDADWTEALVQLVGVE